MLKGRVLKSTGKFYAIQTEGSDALIQASLLGKYKQSITEYTNPIAVGDFVDVSQEDQSENWRITNIYPRENAIIRKSVNLSKQKHIIASNIDRLFLVISLKEPQTTRMFIDRYLVAAEQYAIPTTLIFNKLDLLDTAEKQRLNLLCEIYQTIGYDCFKISIHTQEGLELLREVLHNQTVLFSGHSGVGKSSLLNYFLPDLHSKTAPISKTHKQGQHTTTFAQMHSFSKNSFLIDTPGVKSFDLVDIDPLELHHYFKELFSASSQCKFHNCQHISEPNCEITKRVALGKIDPTRYKNYTLIKNDLMLNNTYRRKKT